MSRPIVALLTDFGTTDHYVGTMKAVVLGVCPDATLVDISHQLPPHDVIAAALELSACYRYFPPRTIFLVVVDPGVGSSRRGIAAETDDYCLVAPDNGVLTAVLGETPPKRVVELTDRKYARPTVSRTFEGRDRFAPAAGWLATGLPLEALGRTISDYRVVDLPVAAIQEDGAAGAVVRVDHFGNLITNLDRKTVDRVARDARLVIRIAGHDIAYVVNTYAEAPPGELCALFGSTDHLEIAVHGGSAAARLGLSRGAPVVVSRA